MVKNGHPTAAFLPRLANPAKCPQATLLVLLALAFPVVSVNSQMANLRSTTSVVGCLSNRRIPIEQLRTLLQTLTNFVLKSLVTTPSVTPNNHGCEHRPAVGCSRLSFGARRKTAIKLEDHKRGHLR
jgi:hypothetical protein